MPSSSLTPLTKQNLREHTQETNPKEPHNVVGIATTFPGYSTTFDSEEQLKEFGVHYTLLRSTLRGCDITSILLSNEFGQNPSAKNLNVITRKAQAANEPKVIFILVPGLVFSDETDSCGEKHISLYPEAQFETIYVPHPNDPNLLLTQPTPDQSNDYIERQKA
jgi:hypothetical protein